MKDRKVQNYKNKKTLQTLQKFTKTMSVKTMSVKIKPSKLMIFSTHT